MSKKINRQRLLRDDDYQRRILASASDSVLDRILADVEAAGEPQSYTQRLDDLRADAGDEAERAAFDRDNEGERFDGLG